MLVAGTVSEDLAVAQQHVCQNTKRVLSRLLRNGDAPASSERRASLLSHRPEPASPYHHTATHAAISTTQMSVPFSGSRLRT